MAITVPLNPPTAQLPPIAKIRTASLQDILNALEYLRLLYNPEVRGTRRIDRKIVFKASRIATEFSEAHEPTTKNCSTLSPDVSLDALCADEFERSYAIRWLTCLVTRADSLADQNRGSDADNLSEEAYTLAWESSIQDAASLLAVCAGTASAGLVSRAFGFRHKTGREVKIQITDAPLDNQDYSSVGAQTWGSACLLAEMIVHSPITFGLDRLPCSQEPMRILELGAGTGLVSLTIGGLLKDHLAGITEARNSVSIVATDFHPSVLHNLQKNITSNTATWPPSCPISVAAQYLDWSNLPSTHDLALQQPFDLIFGADVIYEIEHAIWIRSCIERFLRRPTNDIDMTEEDLPRFHLMIPLRPTHAAESLSVEEVFPFTTVSSTHTPMLRIVSKEILLCETQGSVRSRAAAGSLVEYVHYTIAWL